MKNKEGFTLIELIAVIVILSIIATIAITVVGNHIENAHKESYKHSTNEIIRSAKIYAGKNMLDDNVQYPMVFTCDGTSCKNLNNEKLDFKGEVPKSGKIILYGLNDAEAEYLSNGKFCASGKYGKLDVAKSCGDIDNTKPLLTGVQNKKQVTITMIDNESGIDSYCLVKGNDDCTWTKTNNSTETLELISAGTWHITCKDKRGNISNKLTYTTSQTDYVLYIIKDGVLQDDWSLQSESINSVTVSLIQEAGRIHLVGGQGNPWVTWGGRQVTPVIDLSQYKKIYIDGYKTAANTNGTTLQFLSPSSGTVLGHVSTSPTYFPELPTNERGIIELDVSSLTDDEYLHFPGNCGGGDKYIYNVWLEPGDVTVTFDTQGGTTLEAKSASLNQKIGRLPFPTKEGYFFEGWYTDTNYTTKVDLNYVVTDNITLYAKWIQGVSVVKGGVIQSGWDLQSESRGSVTVGLIQEAGRIHLVGGQGNPWVTWGGRQVTPVIDLSQYKKIYIDGYKTAANTNATTLQFVSPSSGTVLGHLSTSPTYFPELPTNERGIIELDVSSLNGNQYLHFPGNCGGGDKYIYNVFLETN